MKLWGFIMFFCFFCSNTVFSQISFNKHVIDNQLLGACSVYSCDIDGDGDQDILGCGNKEDKIVWWRNDNENPLTFTKFIISSSFDGAMFVSAADIDGDNDMDILGAAWYGNEIAWWRNDGGDPIQWTKESINNSITTPHEIHACDIDGDGNIDIITASAGMNEIAWWKNNGDDPITWTKNIVDNQFNGARSVVGCDINKDGNIDLIGAAFDSDEIALWLNDGNSPVHWNKQVIDNNFDGAHWIFTYDLDLDGNIDILGAAALGNEITCWKNHGGSPIQWSTESIDENFSGALSVSAADLDGDGDIDVFGAATNANTVKWWRYHIDINNPRKKWFGNIIIDNQYSAWPVHGVDIDKDGDTDILSAGSGANSVILWENDLISNIFEETGFPVDFNLQQNYPNPFNPETTIEYELSRRSNVIIRIYDILGKEIRVLINGEKPAGNYNVIWDGKNNNGEKVSSGIYIYQMKAEGFVDAKKMVLLR